MMRVYNLRRGQWRLYDIIIIPRCSDFPHSTIPIPAIIDVLKRRGEGGEAEDEMGRYIECQLSCFCPFSPWQRGEGFI